MINIIIKIIKITFVKVPIKTPYKITYQVFNTLHKVFHFYGPSF